MQVGQPSQTAIGTATFRTLHAYAFSGPAIHEDEMAMPLLGADDPGVLLELMSGAGLPALQSVCAYFACRHRFAEDLMHAAIDGGVGQVVVLGAGLDTFSLRYPELVSRLDFFEVDHPDTQAWKLQSIERAGLPRPEIRFVPVDFERERLAERLAGAGLRREEPVFVSWLGVSLYVEREAALETFRLVGDAPPGSQIVFDVVLPPEQQDDESRALTTAYADGSAERGEPWIGFYAPDELTADLAALGISDVRILDPDEAGRRYYQGQPEGVTPARGWLLVHARS